MMRLLANAAPLLYPRQWSPFFKCIAFSLRNKVDEGLGRQNPQFIYSFGKTNND